MFTGNDGFKLNNLLFSLAGKEMIMPGEDINLNLRFNKQMTLKEGQSFTLRGAGMTIASGKVKL